jgi:hypothetical protein
VLPSLICLRNNDHLTRKPKSEWTKGQIVHQPQAGQRKISMHLLVGFIALIQDSFLRKKKARAGRALKVQ